MIAGCDRWVPAGGHECPPAEACEPCPKCPVAADNTVVAAAGAPAVDRGDIELVYEPSRNEDLEDVQRLVQEAVLFPKVVQGLNEIVALPRDSAVLFTDCGKINAYYDAGAPGIVVCYELLGYFRDLFDEGSRDPEQLDRVVLGATFFGFLHELGHALVDQLELPVTGREEDAVDQLATIILVEAGTDGLEMALRGAESFLLQAKDTRFEKTPFWDEHSFEEQRYFDIVCLAYGSNPDRLKHLVGRHGLPGARAEGCPAEYRRVRKAWKNLLAPHAKAD